jgi:hypothetical protein
MARITWQNVAAPDTNGALRAQATAAELFDRAASTIGNTLTGIDDRNRTDENLAAIGNAMKIQDVGAFDKLMAGSGLQGLGIGEGRANASLMNFLTGRRDSLESDRQTDFNFGQDVYNQGRTQLKDQRFDTQFNRTEEDRLRGEKAADLAFQISNNKGIYTDDEAMRRAEELAKGDRKLEDAIKGALVGRSADINYIDPNVSFDPATTETLRTLENDILAEEQKINLAWGANEDARLLNSAISEFETYTNPLDGLLDRMNDSIDNVDGEEKQKRFNETSGSTTKVYNDLKSTYSDLPPEVVASVMADTFQDDGWFFTGDQLETAVKKAKERLDILNDPDRRNGLRIIENDVRAGRENLNAKRKKIADLTTTLGKAITRKDEAKILEVQTQLGALLGSGSGTRGGGSGGTPTPPVDVNTLLSRAAGAIDAAQGGGNLVAEPASTTNRETAESINQALSPTVSGMRQGFSNILQTLDDNVVGPGLSLIPRTGQGATNVLGGIVSAFSPESGARLFESADRAGETARNLSRDGVLPGNTDFSAFSRMMEQASRENAAPTPSRQNTPVTLAQTEEIIASGSLPPEVSLQAEIMLQALKTSRAPGSGNPLSAEAKKLLEAQLLSLIERAR